jgi:hypothetical protein
MNLNQVSRHNVQYGGARVGNERGRFRNRVCRGFPETGQSELTKSKVRSGF